MKDDKVGKHFYRGRICKKLHVEFTAPDPSEGGLTMITCEWDPRMPEALSPKMRRNYEKARDIFISRYAKATGLRITM